jgi:MinD superfamily P-loop ATPase
LAYQELPVVLADADEVVGRISYDTVVTEVIVRGQPVTAYTDGPVTEASREMWLRIKGRLLAERTAKKGGQR